MRAPRMVAVALALHAGTAGAQDEPPATWDPRAAKPSATAQPPAEPPPSVPPATPTATPTPAPATTPTPPATPTATSTPTAPAPTSAVPVPPPTDAGPASEPEEAPRSPFRLPGPGAGNYRWQVMVSAGPAAEGAPSYLVGVGVALGAIRGTRLELNAFLGWSGATQDVAAQPSWNDDFWTFTSATTSARAFLFELAASRRAGALELRAGGGVHVSTPQFEATYEATRCTDLLCLGPRYRVTDSDAKIGRGATGLLLSAGARLPVFNHVLLGLDLRWLAPATSRVEDRYALSIRTGGFAASAGITVRLGAPVAR